MVETRVAERRLGDVTTKITKGTTPRILGRTDEFSVRFVKVESISSGGTLRPEKFASIDEPTHLGLARSVLQSGDILYTIAGTIGRVARVQNAILPANTNQAVAIIRPDRARIVPRYLEFVLRDERRMHLAMASVVQSVQANLSLGVLSDLRIPVPSITEQSAIADLLGALDDKIASNTKLASTAQRLSSVLYQAALRSEPTLSGGFWDFFTVDFGEAFKGADFAESGKGRPLVRIRDLKTFEPQVWTTEKRVRETTVVPGDVLVGMDAEFRATVWRGPVGLLNQRVCRVSSVRSSAFVVEALRDPLAYIENFKTGTTVAHLNKSDLDGLIVSLPGPEASVQFDRRASGLVNVQVNVAAENRTLAATRDALLPQLMSGKLRVKDAECIVSEVA